ncbi:MAG: helix-turn-helix domain-containing protein [Microthrixaceae bacterium]|nr:helix-turn-helix domain-containing protein [Microthrixaceae bacterium]MCO5313084.1 helix-turn-helix domain-containing protein [Microthrixaceae bacterium]
MASSNGIVWLNTAETARRLGVTPRTLYRFIDEGQLPAYRFGRVIRLKESEVEQFIDNCRIAPGTLETDTSSAGGDESYDAGESETTSVNEATLT